MFLQFNSDTDNQDIVSLTGDLTNTDTVQYPLKAITRAVNKWNKIVWAWVFQAYGGWLYDDSNNTTDFPTATTALVASQVDYGLPSTALLVRGVEVKNTNNTSWYKLFPLTEEQIRDAGWAEAQFYNVASQPRYYVPYANSIKIYPASNYGQAASLRISFGRGSVSFVSTDTVKTPGFVSEFHEVLPVGAAYEFASRKTLANKNDLAVDLKGYELRIKDYYSLRYQELFPSRITVRDAVREAQ